MSREPANIFPCFAWAYTPGIFSNIHLIFEAEKAGSKGWDIIFVDKHHAHTGPEHWWFFWSVFGFVACAGIIIVSKWFGHFKWFGKFTIMAREDYYDK